MPTPTEPQRLDHLAVVEFSGADAGPFLQGQLSNDVMSLPDGAWQLTSLNNPKGRVIAVLRLARTGDRLHALLPQSLAGPIIGHLKRYVLRAKVSIRLASPQIGVCGVPALPEGWVLADRTSQPVPPDPTAVERACRAATIAAGQAQIYPATSELFVAQMLNLDLVDAISFRKGCYTGQEIIARTQNLGRIKRRMLRFATRAEPALAAGEVVVLERFGTATIVEAALTDENDQELLAVVQLEPSPADAASGERRLVEARELPLPYEIPERRAAASVASPA
jgi:folate-binding protein YgfZ